MKKSELQEIIREEISKVLKEKIANESDNVTKGNIFHEYNGKRFKKVGEGKWMEVSKYGMTKKEHESERDELNSRNNRNSSYGSGFHAPLGMSDSEEREKKHRDAASKLSDKEHTDEEVGLKKGGRTPASIYSDALDSDIKLKDVLELKNKSGLYQVMAIPDKVNPKYNKGIIMVSGPAVGTKNFEIDINKDIKKLRTDFSLNNFNK